VTAERVEYSNDVLNPDFGMQEAFLHLDAKGSRTTLGADVGYGRLEATGSSFGNIMGRLMLTRRISASSSISLSLGHQYSNAANAFQISQGVGGANLNTQQTIQTNGASKTEYGTVGWNFARSRTSFGFTLSHFKDQFLENASLDDTRTELGANFSRLLSPTVRFGLYEHYVRQIFSDFTGDAILSSTDARLSWQASRRITLSFDYSFNRRIDLTGTGYTANSVWLSIGYGRRAEGPTGVKAPPLAYPITY
jgi:hypothetical protein